MYNFKSSTLVPVAIGLALLAGPIAQPAAAAPSITPVESGGSTEVTEGGARDYYTLTLPQGQAPDPGELVTINIMPGPQVSVSPQQVTFDASNYSRPRVITVSALNDAVPEHTESDAASGIRHEVASTGGRYAGATADPVAVTVYDNDQASVLVTPTGSGTEVVEDHTTDSYAIALATPPEAPVTISVLPDRAQAGAVAPLTATPSSLVFTAQNYDRPQTVTVTATSDRRAENETVEFVRHVASSTDPNYDRTPVAPVDVTVRDDDAAGVLPAVTGGGLRVAEGSMCDTYTLVLATPPLAQVTVTPVPDPQLMVTPPSATFTSGNWATPQSFSVCAADDTLSEGTHAAAIAHRVTSADDGYLGTGAPSLVVVIIDNDSPGVLIRETGDSTAVTEGGPDDAYTVVLTQQPAAEVTVTLEAGAGLSVEPSVLKFAPGNFSTARTVTVKAVDDRVVQGGRLAAIRHRVSSEDFGYDGLSVDDVVAGIADNDSYGVQLIETGGGTSVVEGGEADRYTVALAAQPAADVEVTVQAPSGVTVTPGRLVFTAENFATPQEVAVSAADDSVAQGPRTATLTHAVHSADAAYEGLASATVQVSIADNDSAGVALRESAGTTTVAEGGDGDDYQIVLLSEPTAEVTVNLNADPALSVEPATVTFTAADWSTPRRIAVSAVQDRVAHGTHLAAIGHASQSGDPAYASLSIGTVVATVSDDDVAGITLSAPEALTAREGGDGASYTLSLTSQPLDTVAIAIDAGADLVAEPASVNFTADDWETPRTIRIRAVDNTAVDGDRTASVRHVAHSTDDAYDARPIADLAVKVLDNDVAAQSDVAQPSNTAGGAMPLSTLCWLLVMSPLLACLRRNQG